MTHQPHAHDDPRDHDHDHSGGVKGLVARVFRPHSHDSADSVDRALETSALGIRAVKISLLVLLGTALAQAVVVAATGSVALLADTIHNFADALTAVPCGSHSPSDGAAPPRPTPTATGEPRTWPGSSSSR